MSHVLPPPVAHAPAARAWIATRLSRLIVLGALAFVFGASGCAMFVQLPTTPRLQALTEEQVFAMAPPPDDAAPQGDSRESAAVDVQCGIGPRTSTGILYGAVSVKGRPGASTVGPLNLALVLDRSGSMHGDPFRNMLVAAETFVNQMRDGDRVSVVAFSDGVFEAAPPVVVDVNSRAAVVAGIRALGDGGGTFFSGGLLAGLAEVFSGFQPWAVNQVVLFSDGQPNIGITSSSELARIAERAAESGVAVTTIGFGRDHDELLMQGIADASGGNYYYVDSPNDMPGIFQREAGAVLRTAARGTTIELQLPPDLALDDIIGYDYVVTGPGHVFVRMGGIPHDEERYVVFKYHQTGGGSLPIDVVYGDLARHGRFGVSCAPRFDARNGGRDSWALELAGRAEAAWGYQEAMAWADTGSEAFVISQLGVTRGIVATLRENLGAQALTQEDNMLLGAQAELGLNVAAGAANSFMSGGVGGLLNFGAKQAVSNATTAVVFNIDKSFRTRVRVGVPIMFYGTSGTRFVAHGTPYKPRDPDASLRFKRARWKTYTMMRSR
ncbi:MAG TPA: VWA domain-containing protein [Polyangia bacterium]|nr:VWA domain-containing protein [Polyangia bacterium]